MNTSRALALTLAALACSCACSTPTQEPAPPPLAELALPERAVLIFYVDGLRPDVLEALMERGELPNLRAFAARGARVEHALASVPSVTFANAVSMVTGQLPGTHGIFANHWFDRERLLTRSYSGVQGRARVNEDLALPTLYELGRGRLSAVVAASVRKGAQLELSVDLESGGLTSGVAWTLDMQQEVDELNAEAVGELIAQARALGDWPTTALFYFPAVDAAAHAHGSDSEPYRAALRSFDGAFGALLAQLEEAGLLAQLTLVLTSDHGHVPAPAARSFAVAPWLKECAPRARVLDVQEDDSDVSFVERRARYREADAVLVVCGARQASLHLRAADEWRLRPEVAAIQSFGGASDLAASLVRAPAIELVAVRLSADEILLQGAQGRAQLERRWLAEGAHYSYRVVAGDDPLGYRDDPAARRVADGRPHDGRAWLAATAHHHHPDTVPQLLEAFDTHRAGDVALFAAPGWDFSADYLGGHGGLAAADMRIPLYLAGPDIVAGRVVHAARLVDLVPTLLDLIGIDGQRPELDGTSFAQELR